MSIQAIAMITVTDREALGAYREKAADALARHGGSVIAADPEPLVLEAAIDAPNMVALLSFPTPDAAKAGIATRPLPMCTPFGNKGGKSTIVVLPG